MPVPHHDAIAITETALNRGMNLDQARELAVDAILIEPTRRRDGRRGNNNDDVYAAPRLQRGTLTEAVEQDARGEIEMTRGAIEQIDGTLALRRRRLRPM